MMPGALRGSVPAAVLTASLASLVVPQGQPVFKATTTYVLVDVFVTDKDDRPVTDLAVNDFEIRESGRLQTISGFELISIAPGTRAIDLNGASAPPDDVFSNAPPAPSGRAFVFVLAHLEPRYIVPIKRLMTEFLTLLRPDDAVAIVYPTRSDLSQDFTKNQSLQVRAVNKVTHALGLPPRVSWGDYLRNVINALAAARENRRAVIFVSQTAPSILYDPGMREVVEDSRRFNIPIYTIDPRALMAPELGLEGSIEDQTPERRMGLDRAVRASKDRLKELASNTNGRAYVDVWNLAHAARDLIADNASYYLLGFSPTPDEPDGKFHKVDVRVKRPGMRVRARAGYTSEKPRPASTSLSRLPDPLGAGLPVGDLRLQAFAAAIAPTRRGAMTLLTLRVEYPPLVHTLKRVDDRLRMAWVAVDPDARIKASGEKVLSVHIDHAPSEAFIAAVDDFVDLPKGRLTLRVSVSSDMLARNGTVHVPLDVKVLGGTSLDATPLIIGVENDAIARAGAPASSGRTAPFPVTTRRMFSPRDRLRIFSRLFLREGDTVSVELVLKQDSAIVRAIPVRMTPSNELLNATDCNAVVELHDHSAGAYILELIARSTSRSETLRRSVGVEIKVTDGVSATRR